MNRHHSIIIIITNQSAKQRMHFNTNSMATTLCWGSMSTASTSQLVAAAFVPNIENLASNSYDTKARNMFFKR